MPLVGHSEAPHHGVARHPLVGLDELKHQALPGRRRELLLKNVLQFLYYLISAEGDEAAVSLKEFIQDALYAGNMLLPQGAVLAGFLPRLLCLFRSAQIGALKQLLGHMVPDAAHIADEDAGIRGCQTPLPFWPGGSPKAIGKSTGEEAGVGIQRRLWSPP